MCTVGDNVRITKPTKICQINILQYYITTLSIVDVAFSIYLHLKNPIRSKLVQCIRSGGVCARITSVGPVANRTSEILEFKLMVASLRLFVFAPSVCVREKKISQTGQPNAPHIPLWVKFHHSCTKTTTTTQLSETVISICICVFFMIER